MKGYWVICTRSYEFEGKEICKGHMHVHYSERPIINNAWRRATEKEIERKKWHKGIWYCHSEFLND